jgi:hypothetical protein
VSRDFDYESNWQQWWVKYSESGIPYLQLEGMHMCLQWIDMDCENPDKWGGTNFCEGKYGSPFPSNKKAGVLMVLGVPKRWKQPPKGIELVSYETTSYHVITYTLQEP